jgi:hypothetical protein
MISVLAVGDKADNGWIGTAFQEKVLSKSVDLDLEVAASGHRAIYAPSSPS